MAELAYREVYAMNRSEARKQLVRTYLETGSVSATARLWHTSRQVVRKWVTRYREQAPDLVGGRGTLGWQTFPADRGIHRARRRPMWSKRC